FAFEFVLNVLRDRHPFYAYEELKRRHNARKGSKRPSLRLMKLLFRISSRLDLKYLSVIGNLDPLLTDALTLPSSQATIDNTVIPSLTVVASDTSASDSEIAEAILNNLNRGGSAILFGHNQIAQHIYEQMPHGIMFHNGSEPTIIVGQKHLPKQQFLVLY
ncbi:MAG: hypothetical protein K2M98_02910, partial [Muribaculum sp.]|nr:hypothetical protein [Muribaculum sp.]